MRRGPRICDLSTADDPQSAGEQQEGRPRLTVQPVSFCFFFLLQFDLFSDAETSGTFRAAVGRSGQLDKGPPRCRSHVPAHGFVFLPRLLVELPVCRPPEKKKNGTLSSLFAPSCQICWLPCKSAREVLTSCLCSDLLFYLLDTFDFTKETNKSPTDLDKTASLALCFQPPAKTDARVAATLVWT